MSIKVSIWTRLGDIITQGIKVYLVDKVSFVVWSVLQLTKLKISEEVLQIIP